MKQRGIMNNVFAGCKKTPVIAFIPVCFAIDIDFV